MTPAQRVELIRPGILSAGGTWADLGAGSGAFTGALARLLGPGALIYAVDRDRQALRGLTRLASADAARVVPVEADFTDEVSLPPLDGALCANSLHFQADACRALQNAVRWLRPGALLLIVEYDQPRANPWVPYPLPWSACADVARRAGLEGARLLGRMPSAYHGSMYAAACRKPETRE